MADDTPREEIHNEPVVPADEVAAAMVARFPDVVFHDSHGQAVLYVDRGRWHDVARALRDDERFTQCLDVCAVDHLVDEARLAVTGVAPERFELVANFLSHPRNRRIRAIAVVVLPAPRGHTTAIRVAGSSTAASCAGWQASRIASIASRAHSGSRV